MTRRITLRAVRAAAITVLIAALSAGALAVSNAIPVAGGLDSPRGIAAGPAERLIYAEGNGAISELIANGKNAGSKNLLNSVPATFIAPNVATLGGQIFVLTAQGDPATGSNTLYRVSNGTVRALANIAAYQQTDPDPFNLAGPPEESNPFGLTPLPDGSVLVSDAAANDLLRVYPNGQVVTVARLKPRIVSWPAGIPFGPPAGTMAPSEDVATSVTVGADGYYYVGELRGVPATPGTSQVWRIAPDSVNAVCDPANPNVGACRRYADGFTSIVDLEAGPDGSIYVVQLANSSWLKSPVGPVGGPDVGSVWRLAPGGGSRTELAPGQLHLPAGVAVTSDSSVYVTTPVFGPASIVKVQ
jgi:hypothetical protein